jgi:hypothetical protein
VTSESLGAGNRSLQVPDLAEPLCDGMDAHLLSVPIGVAAIVGWIGLLLFALAIRYHLGALALVTGIVLGLTPLSAVLFSKRVVASSLEYRTWGVKRRLPLERVDVVNEVSGSRTAIELHPASGGESITLALVSRYHVVPRVARAHLLRWLNHSDVVITPRAMEMLSQGEPRSGSRRRMRGRAVIGVVSAAASVALLVAGPVVRHSAQLVPGAPDYLVATNNVGQAVELGLPWGTQCADIQVVPSNQMSIALYDQFRSVVPEANSDGLALRLDNRTLFFGPPSPPSELTSGIAEAAMVGIYSTASSGPVVDDHPQLMTIQPYLSTTTIGNVYYFVMATFYRPTQASGLALRTAVRQLLAFSEGLGTSTTRSSGLRDGTKMDSFTSSDVRALGITSGCPVK